MLYTDLVSHSTQDEFSHIAPYRIFSFDIECCAEEGGFPEPEKDALPRDKNTMAIAVTSPTLLQINCTAPLLSSIASAVESFVQCRHSRHRRGDGCFVGVKNGTGLEMTYCIESDGGVNHTLMSASERARQAMQWDELLFEDMVEVEVESTLRYMEVLRHLGRDVPELSRSLCHIIASGMFNGIFEIVVHDMPRDQAMRDVDQLRDFYTAGWLKVMGQ